jgi:tRNA A-37 threonylcarbamoyl transferase component Bud32
VNFRLEDQAVAGLAPELELVRLLGEGSTARVYLAREPALDRLVAIKVLRPEYAADETARRRFEREARASARISHPNVIQVYRVGRLASGQPYIVMAYVEGRTLADLLAARGPLPAADASAIFAAVASALAAAHACGVVHRDVRPDNVFVSDRSSPPMLTDFGIAALLDDGGRNVTRLTAVGQRLGEVRYMSPEQLRGGPMTGQSDVYALGVLAFDMLTARGPFDDRPFADLVNAHLSEQPASIAALRPDLDRGFAAIVDRCLDKRPDRRPRASDIPALLQARAQTARGAGPADTGFLAELKRRRVYQVVVAYAAAAFVVLQGVDLLAPALPGLDAYYNVLVAVTLAGFPLAVLLSWVYDLTSAGLQRTDTTGAGNSRRHRLLAWSGFGFSVVLAVFLWWYLTRP